VKVLDLGVVIAGAYAGSILASLGADVLKVEAPSGDPFRAYGTGFAHYNRGKRSRVFDLKRADDIAALLDLARDADVVLDNFRLGVRERLGITYERLRAINPRVISCSISGYGTEGPQAAQPGFDPLLQAQSGLMGAQGGDGSEPVFHGIPVNDVGSAAIAALGIVAALHARSHTGVGQEVHTSLAAQSVLLQIGELTSHATAPSPPTGARDCTGTSAFEQYYECADGWIGIACTTPEQQTALARALDLDPAIDETATPLLSATFAKLDVETALNRLEAAGAPAAPALRLADTYTSPFFVENEHYEEFVDTEFGAAIGTPRLARFGRTDTRWLAGAPPLGTDVPSREADPSIGER
jgi:crotonobetainyl-CoA:carnitine CoA-transferase CaiB-like acyl-CoA transferase